MNAKHTPGPWTLVEVNTDTVKGAVHVYGGGAPITTDVWGPTLAESDANARLIAAAPALLSALKAVYAYFARMGPPLGESALSHTERTTRAEVAAAIAEASGDNK